MNGRIVVFGVLAFWVASCGGQVENSFFYQSGGTGGVGTAGRGGSIGAGGRGGSSSLAGSAGIGAQTSGTGGRAVIDAGFEEYNDPGCPDAEAPTGVFECDPLAPISGCAAGYGCYPYVDHPFGAGCDQQTYGALCLVPGLGVQGDSCGDDSPIQDYCAPGYVCVIGVRAGKRCARLCSLTGVDVCPPGLVCGDLDVEGYGVCG